MEHKVVILTPSCRNPSWYYTNSLLALMLHTREYGISGQKAAVYHYVMPKCSCLPGGRQWLLNAAIAQAKEGNLTHAIFIDDDMQFDTDILDYLVRDGKCVCANVLRKEEGELRTPNTVKNGKLLDSSVAVGMEEIYSTGLAMFCMDLKEVMKTKAPHFVQPYDPTTETYLGEDVAFTSKLRAAGVKLYCSHEASRKVGHLGERMYKYGT